MLALFALAPRVSIDLKSLKFVDGWLVCIADRWDSGRATEGVSPRIGMRGAAAGNSRAPRRVLQDCDTELLLCAQSNSAFSRPWVQNTSDSGMVMHHEVAECDRSSRTPQRKPEACPPNAD